MVADPRQIVEDDAIQLIQLEANVFGHTLHVGIAAGVDVRTAQVIVPVWPGFDLDRLAGDHRNRSGDGLVVTRGGIEQILVAKGKRFVIILEAGQRRIKKQFRQPSQPGMEIAI